VADVIAKANTRGMGFDDLRFEQLNADAVQPLRTRLLRPGHEGLCEYEVDRSHDTRHYGLVDGGGEPRAVITMFPETCPQLSDEPALRVRGLCVDAALRGRGLGRRLLDSAIARAALTFLSARFVWCNARTSATSFYEACGFEAIGEVFDVPDIGPHVVMWRPMPVALA
jgi:predicted GNAT family N-acyltransferase